MRSNTNPFKNGPYARHISRQELTALKKMPSGDLEQEIGLLRIFIARLLDLAARQEDIDAITKITRTFAQLISTLNSTLRSQTQLAEPSSAWDEALAGALKDVPFYITPEMAARQKPHREEPVGFERGMWEKVFGEDPGRRKQPRRSKRAGQG